MPFQTSAALAPRQELSYAIMEGASLNKSLIWDQVLPPLPLTQRTAHLPKLTFAATELARIITDVNAPGADIPRISAGLSDFTLNVAIRKMEIGIPVEAEMDYAKLFSLEAFWSKHLGNKYLSLTLEYLVAQAIFNTTNFGAATNSGVAYTVANIDTISLIADLVAALNRVRDAGEEPDTVVIPAQVWERCAQSKLVSNFVIGQLGAISEITTTTLETALRRLGFEVKVLIGRAQYNSAAKGSKTLTRVWANTYIWVGRAGYKNDTTDDGIPIIDGVGCTAYWSQYGLMIGEAYLDQPKEQNVVRGKLSGNPTIFNANAGTLIATQYS
jgi:hypothetical protein